MVNIFYCGLKLCLRYIANRTGESKAWHILILLNGHELHASKIMILLIHPMHRDGSNWLIVSNFRQKCLFALNFLVILIWHFFFLVFNVLYSAIIGDRIAYGNSLPKGCNRISCVVTFVRFLTVSVHWLISFVIFCLWHIA